MCVYVYARTGAFNMLDDPDQLNKYMTYYTSYAEYKILLLGCNGQSFGWPLHGHKTEVLYPGLRSTLTQ